VKDADLSLLRGERTIAVNRALELLEPTIWFSADPRVVGWIESGVLGETARQRFHAPTSLKCVVVTSPDRYFSELPMLDRCHDIRLTMSMKEGLFTGTGLACNSGLGALNLALCLAADPVYLIGFDMKTDAHGHRTWCERDYPNADDVADLGLLLEAFAAVADQARARARIVNLNPNSALTCFEFGTIDALARGRPQSSSRGST
jgi:hypothetical protein